MRDLILLIKQRKAFYGLIIIVTMIITFCCGIYTLNQGTRHSLCDADMSTITEEQVVQALENQEEMFFYGADSGKLMDSFMQNNSFPGYLGVLILSYAILAFCCYGMYEKSTKEFLETLPVKKIALETYNYVAVMGIFGINALLALAINLIGLTLKNNEIVDLAARFPQVLQYIVPSGLVMQANVTFCLGWCRAVLFMAAFITVLYVFMSLFKNQVAGLIIGFVTWFVVGAKVPSVATIWVQIAIIVIGVVILLIHGKIRELSKGKIFFVEFLHPVFLILGGIALFVLISDEFGYPAGIFITLIAEALGIAWLYYGPGTIRKMEVSERKKHFLPVWKLSIRSFLITVVILTVSVVYLDRVQLHAQYLYMKSLIAEGFGRDTLAPMMSYFDPYDRIQLGLVIILGLVIYKCIRFLMEKKSGIIEFYETLPVSRLNRTLTGIGMDLLVVFIPMLIYTLVNLGYIKAFNVVLKLDVSYIVAEQFVLLIAVLAIATVVLGIIHLIDAVTVNGGLKVLYVGVAGLTILIFGGFIPEIMEWDAIYDLFELLAGELEVSLIVGYFIVGILLLAVAVWLSIRKEISKYYFSFTIAKHVFIILVCLIYLFITIYCAWMERAVIHYILAVAGTIVGYIFMLEFFAPVEESKIKSKIIKKKA